jgi:hypothetical protein
MANEACPIGKSLFLTATFLVGTVVPIAAQAGTAGWPETMDLLAEQRSQAESCVDTLKSSGDKGAITAGRNTYNKAKAKADGVIAGFTVALVQGGKPEELPNIQANVEKAGAGLQEVCDAAVKAASSASGTKGVVEDIAKGAIGPVVDGIKSAAGALWARHVEKDALEIETIKGQLEAAKWPEFAQ